MGVEKEKLDTSIIMDEDEFNRSIEPFLSKKGYSAAPDRDPNEINPHLKVRSVCRDDCLKVKTSEAMGSAAELSITLLFHFEHCVFMTHTLRLAFSSLNTWKSLPVR